MKGGIYWIRPSFPNRELANQTVVFALGPGYPLRLAASTGGWAKEEVMKKIIYPLFVFLIFLNLPALASAAEAPVILTHQLTLSQEGPVTLTLYYTVHLKNPGRGALTNLKLFLVPPPTFMVREPVVLKVSYLGPRETADLQMALPAWPLQSAGLLALRPLYFSGKGNDAQGRPLVFRAVSRLGQGSHSGGAK
jgi:hypothetical protein